MTAEVVVANKVAVALAADSTVTIRGGRADKTYNTANKLSSLHKVYPVGALIYGATSINGVPLEIAIKEFRHSLPADEKDNLRQYADAFLDFLRQFVPITEKAHEDNFRQVVREYSRRLRLDIRDALVDRQIAPNAESAVRSVVTEYVQEFRHRVDTAGRSASVHQLTRASLSQAYPNIVEQAVTRAFQFLEPTASLRRRIVDVIYDACLSNELTDNRIGMVVTGYGRNDFYPTIISFEMDGFFAGHLKMIPVVEEKVETGNEAIVHPFAQRELAALFMEGVDPVYQEYVNSQISEIIPGLAPIAANYFGSHDARRISRLRRSLQKLSDDVIDDLGRRREEWFIGRTIEAIEFLDKSELAAFAESLINLTALRQKVSLDMETVGGPVDVAVISKGDGFIWIRRKHYFTADLNPFYFKRYLR